MILFIRNDFQTLKINKNYIKYTLYKTDFYLLIDVI